MTLIIGNTRDRPIVCITGHFGLFMVKLLMESEVKSMFDVAATLRVFKDDLVISVLVIGDARLVPGPRRHRPVRKAFVLINDRWHLVFAHGQLQLLHLQASVVVDSVEIGDLTILVIQFPMEIEGLSLTDTGVNYESVVGRIYGQIELDDAVAAMDAMIRIGHLT